MAIAYNLLLSDSRVMIRDEAGRPGICLDDGQIIEEGQHEKLLQNDGLYARLYEGLQH